MDQQKVLSNGDFSSGGGGFSLSSGGGLGGLFHDACMSSASPCHCTNSSENRSIFKSNMSSSPTILHHLGLDPSGLATACSLSSGVGLGGVLFDARVLHSLRE